ncbi:copper resistance protein B [Bordetella bronchiseptica]|nr:copper resistance protein B [Bordetella bronchiseptica]KAK67133.1 copper resistance protein B CopB [Bordetella bronchiseptica MO211]CCN17620.1 copper resistance b subname: full=copper resistance protein b flags: precursor [Bordetella bronchiseptica MO211]
MKTTHLHALTLALVATIANPVLAQSQAGQEDDHSAHHGAAAASVASPSAAPADPHAGHGAPATPATAPATPASTPPMDHGGMDMQMQGGSAPADARDPNAYSEGMVRGAGAYAVPGVPALSLADEHTFGALLVDRLERSYANHGGNATAYDLQGWFGRDFDKAVLKAEGEVAGGKLQDARTELLWGHAITPYWDTQLGLRYDTGTGPGRGWLAFGVQGLAPYWFDVEATGYVGDGGRTALRLAASYDLLLTQKLILQPRAEAQFYGKSDPERDIGSGLSNATVGLRLRYEFSRQFAPYIGVERSGSFGKTADFVRASGERAQETRWVAGVRFWF